MTDKWMPEAGQECEVVDAINSFVECEILSVKNGHAFYYVPSMDAVGMLAFECFRPITTEADKHRDEQKKKLAQLYIRYSMANNRNGAGSYLYDAGCRILAPDERIVKPLTDEQVTDKAHEYAMEGRLLDWVAGFEYGAHWVRRELGLIE